MKAGAVEVGEMGFRPDAESAGAAVSAAKARLRARLLVARAALAPMVREDAGHAIADAAAAYLAGRGWPTLAAAYVSVGTEPPTGPLLETLAAAGVELIVPVLRDDGELDWAPFAPGDPLVPGLKRTLAPATARLGVQAIEAADLVVVPALAVDRRGRRLGRGGGSYDRALPRARPGAVTLATVYRDELLDEVPVAAHDRRVGGALTPEGLALAIPEPTS